MKNAVQNSNNSVQHNEKTTFYSLKFGVICLFLKILHILGRQHTKLFRKAFCKIR